MLLVALLGLGVALGPPDVLRVGAFSSAAPGATLPDGWERISFSDIDTATQYDLVRADSATVVRARSDGGASGLATETRVDLTEYPVLEWRWTVDGVLPDGDARTRAGDDYPARRYVTFDYDDLGLADKMKRAALRVLGYDDIPSRALNYVRANRVPRDTVLANAYTDWVMMVAVRSGEGRAGEWVAERRNVLTDYRAAYYGDIRFRAAPDTAAGRAR
jgi:hypothetical protein